MGTTNKYFLATTALESFLGKEKKLFFLGEWCKLGHDVTPSETFPFLWDASSADIASLKCWEIYDELLDSLAEFLNKIHNIDKSKRYWEIIIGNWLYTYIQVVYDRYHTLNAFISEYQEFETILLSPKSYATPTEYSDFVSKVCDDGYNLQLYSQILKFLGYRFECRECDIGQLDRYSAKAKSAKKTLFLKALRFFGLNKPQVTITSPYFSGGVRSYMKLLWESRGAVDFEEFDDRYDIVMSVDMAKRKPMEKLYSGDDEFMSLLYHLLPQNFPMLFMEGYEDMRGLVLKKKPPKTKLYATANALYSNYVYKFWTAEYISNIKLVLIHHGGGYGIAYLNSPEMYERRIVDRFFTWGWKEDNKTIPMTHEKICQKISPDKDGSILYVQTQNPRYMMRLQNSYNSSAFPLSYIPKAISFLQSAGRVERFLFRGRPGDNGFEVTKRVTEGFPEMKVSDNSKKFHRELQQARLVVCDHMHTTYLETLAMNFPTVIFIDPNYYSFRKPEIIQKLIDAGILYYDEKKAAEHINAVYDDIDRWWYSSEVQNAREEFCRHYARTSDNWARDWVLAFKKAADKRGKG